MPQGHVNVTALDIAQFRAAAEEFDQPIDGLDGQHIGQETLGQAKRRGRHRRRRIMDQLVVHQTVF